MSKKEKERIALFEQLKPGEITQKAAGERLNLSTRQISTKAKRYKKDGTNSLIHKNRGRPSHRKLGAKQEAFILELLKSDIWRGFGPTYASQKLMQHYGVKVSRETLRKLMRREMLPYETRNGPKRRRQREHNRMFGTMIQLDGSPYK